MSTPFFQNLTTKTPILLKFTNIHWIRRIFYISHLFVKIVQLSLACSIIFTKFEKIPKKH